MGHRASLTLGGLLYGTGYAISAFGVYAHNIWLLWGGIGLVGGFGIGMVYTPAL